MITLILPYYRAPQMLRLQLDTMADYPLGYRVIVVDDGSPEPAVIEESDRADLYRIHEDIPWNRNGARNLGASVAETDWIMQIDIDHVMPPPAAAALLRCKLDPACWYRFPRYRVGKADDTRKKDDIPDSQEFGKIRPHIDSYVVTREMYWRAGGYNEDFSGCLGGGSPFLKQLGRVGRLDMLPEDVFLHVYTRSKVADASVSTLSRDRKEYERRCKLFGAQKGQNPIRFTWSRVI